MEGKVHPKPISSPTKPLNGAAATNGGARGGPPSTKAQLHGAARPAYRPLPPPPPRPLSRRRKHRGCCLWLSLIFIALALLSATAAGVFYALYRPRSPGVSLSSLRLSELNRTASGLLTARLDVSVVARNPNERLVFFYGPTTVSASSHGVTIGEGAFPAFAHGPRNTTVLRATLLSSRRSVGAAAAAALRKRGGLLVDIEMETSVVVEIGRLKTKRVRVGVSCIGIRMEKVKANQKSGVAAASTGDVECKAKVYVKLWDWTV